MRTIFITLLLFCAATSSIAQNSKIKVYFTRPVDNTISAVADGIHVSNMDDTICAYINKAQQTLDMAIYDNTSSKIVSCINAAYQRGVRVRYITSSASLNTALSGLNAGINKLVRSSYVDIMHNKFTLIDVGSATNSYVLSGSMNYTSGNMFEDPNNFIIIQDQALVQAYTTEFEEMWGSSTAMYDLNNSKFGDAKSDNTPHSFNINGTSVNLYFSPSDGTTAHIESAINSCNADFYFAMFTFNQNDLGDATIALKNSGKIVKGIMENIDYLGSEYPGFISAGVDVLSHNTIAGSFHHKYGLVDPNNISSDPLVIAGSHNWTNSAETDYDENTLIIHDAYIANQYYEEFMTRYNEIITGINTKNSVEKTLRIISNPVHEYLTWNFPEALFLYMSDVSGRKINIESKASYGQSLDVRSLPKGVYFAYFQMGNSHQVLKVVKM